MVLLMCLLALIIRENVRDEIIQESGGLVANFTFPRVALCVTCSHVVFATQQCHMCHRGILSGIRT